MVRLFNKKAGCHAVESFADCCLHYLCKGPVCLIMGYEQIDQSLKLITDHSAQTLNIQDRYGIEEGKPGNLVILPADSGYDAIRRQTAPRYVIRAGKILAETKPSVTQIHLDKLETINFKR